jgi:small-conductance mechanosensitive channel
MHGVDEAAWVEWIRRLLPFLTPPAAILLGLWARKLIFRRLTRWAQKTKTDWDDVLVASVRTPFLIWCAMIGIYLALRLSPLPEKIVVLAGKALLILSVISLVMAAWKASTTVIQRLSRISTDAVPLTSLTQNVVRILLTAIGALVILNSLGISVTPMLATLGVGGLAVALALQDTLSNLFAGFHLIASHQIRTGDYIRLESGGEGFVTDISWRITKIRMLSNNIVQIPNAKLAQSVLVNYSMPEKDLSVLVEAGVHYDSNLKRVETVVCDVAAETLRTVSGGIQDFEPFIRYHTFGESGILFTVILRAKEFTDQYLVKHEFIKRLHERFRKEGIVIPYPIRIVQFDRSGLTTEKMTERPDV